MSQPSSPPFSQDSDPQPEPRRLISPAERFAPPASEAPPAESSTPEPFKDPFVPEGPPRVSRRAEEMARRHLPPRERRKHERTVRTREKREASREVSRRIGADTVHHDHRAQVEREFTQHARSEAPKTVVKPRRRLPVWLKRLFLLIAILFVGQMGFAVFTAPQFEIQTVSITGTDSTPQTQVIPLAAKLRGQNILRANRAAVEKAVEKLPTVADAHVSRLPVWPPKVQLQITERQPVLQVGAGNDWWVIDRTGVAFRRAGTEDGGLYQVVAPDFAPELGKKLDAKGWMRAARLNAALQDDNRRAAQEQNSTAGPFWQLRRIYFDKDGLASLRLTGKGALAAHNEMLVRLGDDRWQEKLGRARIALTYFENTGRQAAELDMVSFERPVWRPKPTQLASQSEGETTQPRAG